MWIFYIKVIMDDDIIKEFLVEVKPKDQLKNLNLKEIVLQKK